MKSKIIYLTLALVLVFSLSTALVQEAHAQSLSWVTKKPLPQAMTVPCSVAVLGKIHTISKVDGHSPSLHFEYNPITDLWIQKATPPLSDRYGMASAVYKDKIYLFGGVAHGGPLSNVAIYNPATDSWSTGTNMPSSSAHSTATVVGDKMYIVGGTSPTYGDSGGSVVLQIYNPATDSWSTGANMPTKRQGAMAAAVNNRIYVIGGYSGGTIYNVVEEYDPATDTWSTRTPIPTAGNFGIAAVINDEIFVMGSYYFGGTVYTYDPATDTWTTGPNMPTPRYDFADSSDAVLNGCIYVVDGADGSGRVPTVEALCTTTTTKCVATATSTGTACFTPDAGNITGLSAVAEGSLPPGAQATKPINFPDGLFSFNVTGLSTNATVNVTITLPPGSAPTQYWKYHASEGGWIQIPMTVVGPPNVIRITLQDGGLGDDDLTANGVIVDQGGPGNPGPGPAHGAVGWETYPTNKVRVLLPWIALVAAIVTGASLLALNRRRGTGSSDAI